MEHWPGFLIIGLSVVFVTIGFFAQWRALKHARPGTPFDRVYLWEDGVTWPRREFEKVVQMMWWLIARDFGGEIAEKTLDGLVIRVVPHPISARGGARANGLMDPQSYWPFGTVPVAIVRVMTDPNATCSLVFHEVFEHHLPTCLGFSADTHYTENGELKHRDKRWVTMTTEAMKHIDEWRYSNLT